MATLEVLEASEHEQDLECPYPSYKDPGRILVRVLGPYEGPTQVYRWEYEILEWAGGACEIIYEGAGFEWWLDNTVEEISGPGVWLVAGITGSYIRGDWSWGEDDDEEWEYETCRPGTLREHILERLSPEPDTSIPNV